MTSLQDILGTTQINPFHATCYIIQYLGKQDSPPPTDIFPHISRTLKSEIGLKHKNIEIFINEPTKSESNRGISLYPDMIPRYTW